MSIVDIDLINFYQTDNIWKIFAQTIFKIKFHRDLPPTSGQSVKTYCVLFFVCNGAQITER